METQGARKVVGNRGPARSGATSAWFGEFRVRKGAPGCIRELSGSVSGSFRGRRMWPLARKSASGAFWELQLHWRLVVSASTAPRWAAYGVHGTQYFAQADE